MKILAQSLFLLHNIFNWVAITMLFHLTLKMMLEMMTIFLTWIQLKVYYIIGGIIKDRFSYFGMNGQRVIC